MGIRRLLTRKWRELQNGILTGPGIDVDSVSTEEGTIGGFPMARGIAQDDWADLTWRSTTTQPINADSWGTIFSVGGSVDIIHGTVYGASQTRMRVTWEDGTTDTIDHGFIVADTIGGTTYSITPIPAFEGIKTLEIYNDASGSRDYASLVVTA